MFKRCSIFISLLFLCPALFPQTVPEPTGRRLRDIISDKFADGSVLIGGTTGAWAFGTQTGAIMDREFDYVTPENDFKQWNIHPDPNTWNWKQTDDWIDHIEEYGQILRMHCPIGPQCSSWAQTDSRTAEELEQVMRDYMQQVCQRYDGVDAVVSMDVVNEVVQNGSWKKNETGTGGWEMPWYIIGRDSDPLRTPLFIRYAFEIATEYAPNTKLIFNHHEGPESESSWNRIKKTVNYLRDLGLRVDGIGWQAHVNNGWATTTNLKKLRDLIDWAQTNDLEFHVTEASVWINGTPSESAIRLQANTYCAIVDVLLEKRFGGLVGWNTWHIDDGHGWQNEKAPSLFDADYVAKPAYYAIQDALENPPTAVDNSRENPRQSFSLRDNYPNPFNPTTTISYELAENAEVTLTVFNARGEKVASLVNEQQTTGVHQVSFDASELSSGIYLYKLQANDRVLTRKMVLAR